MGSAAQSVPEPPNTRQVATQQFKTAIKYLPKMVRQDYKLQREYDKRYLQHERSLLPKQEKLQEGYLKIANELTKQGAKNNLKLLNRFDDRYLRQNVNEAKKLTDKQLDLYSKFGDRIARTERNQMEALDPKAFAAREAAGKAVLQDLKLGSSLSDSENREWEQSVRAAQASRGNVLGNAPVTSEAMTKGRAGFDRYQTRLSNAKNFGDTMMKPSQRPQIATIQSGRSQVPTGLPQYQQFGTGNRGMRYFTPSMAPQSDPLGAYNAQVAAQQANQRPNPWATVGSQAAAGASFGTTISPGWGTLIGGVAGAGVGAVQAWA